MTDHRNLESSQTVLSFFPGYKHMTDTDDSVTKQLLPFQRGVVE